MVLVCPYQRYIEWMVGYVDVALTVGSYGGVVDDMSWLWDQVELLLLIRRVCRV